jgi:hypothetical protein
MDIPRFYSYLLDLPFVTINYIPTLKVFCLPSMIFRSVQTGVAAPAPAVSDELIVLAYNNQNGYNSNGQFNGHCYTRIVEEFHADYVSIPEGDAMHLTTGNRDAVDFYTTRLNYHVDFGAAGNVESVGVATLSTRPLHASVAVALPKTTATNLNRWMTVHDTIVDGVTVAMASVRCAFSDRNLHSRMPLDPTPARLKRADV